MWRRASYRSSAALLILAALVAACSSTKPVASVDPNADVVIHYPVAGAGEITFTVRPRYTTGAPITFQLDISAGTVAVRGPVTGRVLASGLDGEKIVRTFSSAELGGTEVAAGQRQRVPVTWDAKDSDGKDVPAETYSLSLDFIIGAETQRYGTVIEVRAP